MRSSCWRSYFDASGVLLCEVALFGFFIRAGGLLGTVPPAHFWARRNRSGPREYSLRYSGCWGCAYPAGCS